MKENNFLRKYHLKFLLSLTILALITRLLNLNFVNKVIFDEVHFGKFITQYLKGEYFFDIHPPLGKLLLFGLAKPAKLNPSTNFSSIGLIYPPHTPIGALRFLPALMGTLLVPFIFLLAEIISHSSRAGLIASLLILFDNAFIVQSRLISLDMLMLFFILGALYFYLKAKQTYKSLWLILAGINGGLAVSTKWIGLTGLAIVYTLLVFEYMSSQDFRNKKLSLKHLCFLMFTLIVIPFIIYYSTFAIHFKILSKPGDGNAFMSKEFNNSFYSPERTGKQLSLFKKFVELNIVMYRSNLQNLTHHYSSKWFTWPLMVRPVSYLHSFLGNNQVQNITFIGNPFVWWLSTLGIITFIILISFKKILPTKFKNIPDFSGKGIVLLGYLIAYLPFISISRCMFLYHYLTALIFAIIATAILLDKFLLPKDREIPSPFPSIVTLITGLPLLILISRAVYLWYIPKESPFLIGSFFILLGSLFSLYLYFITKRNIYKIPNLWLMALFFTLIGCFLIFSPLSYGMPIKQKTFDFYMWIKSWI